MIDHEQRLRHLSNSWALRAKPGAPGNQQADLLLENISAVEAAISAMASTRTAHSNLQIMIRDLRKTARLGATAKRREIIKMIARMEEVTDILAK